MKINANPIPIAIAIGVRGQYLIPKAFGTKFSTDKADSLLFVASFDFFWSVEFRVLSVEF